jgi:hypothetical protein
MDSGCGLSITANFVVIGVVPGYVIHEEGSFVMILEVLIRIIKIMANNIREENNYAIDWK